jgi:hypothetical protein
VGIRIIAIVLLLLVVLIPLVVVLWRLLFYGSVSVSP